MDNQLRGFFLPPPASRPGGPFAALRMTACNEVAAGAQGQNDKRSGRQRGVAGGTGCEHGGLLRVKCERPSADAEPFLVHWFNCNESSETQLYFWEIFDVVCFEDCGGVLNR